jgi:hypothetical protein
MRMKRKRRGGRRAAAASKGDEISALAVGQQVELSFGQEVKDKLDLAFELTREENPERDPALLFTHALKLLVEQLEKENLALKSRPRLRR